MAGSTRSEAATTRGSVVGVDATSRGGGEGAAVEVVVELARVDRVFLVAAVVGDDALLFPFLVVAAVLYCAGFLLPVLPMDAARGFVLTTHFDAAVAERDLDRADVAAAATAAIAVEVIVTGTQEKRAGTGAPQMRPMSISC